MEPRNIQDTGWNNQYGQPQGDEPVTPKEVRSPGLEADPVAVADDKSKPHDVVLSEDHVHRLGAEAIKPSGT